MNNELEQKIHEILKRSLLDEEEVARREPWGEDGCHNAFGVGKKYGAHELAERILKLLNSK